MVIKFLSVFVNPRILKNRLIRTPSKNPLIFMHFDKFLSLTVADILLQLEFVRFSKCRESRRIFTDCNFDAIASVL